MHIDTNQMYIDTAPHSIDYSSFLLAVIPEVQVKKGEAKMKMRQRCKERMQTDSVTGIEREKEIMIKWKKAVVVEWLC